MIAIVLVTHGVFGQELLRTAQDIVGRQESVLGLSVSSETGIENLSRSIGQAMEQFKALDGVLFLVDMMGGTPCNAVLLKTRSSPAEVVTGVNLYMVISAFTHRDHMDLRTLAEKVSDDGKRAIQLAKDLLKKVTS